MSAVHAFGAMPDVEGVSGPEIVERLPTRPAPNWAEADIEAWVGGQARLGKHAPAVRDGWQTVRVCSMQVALPVGCQELVVDVFRMKTMGARKKRDAVGGADGGDACVQLPSSKCAAAS